MPEALSISSSLKPEGEASQILHLERQLLAWNKPAGVETQDEEAARWLQREIQLREGREGTPFLQPIHRLDKPTSGIVLFARSSKSLSRLQGALRERRAEKAYLAWVEGRDLQKGRLVDRISHGSHEAYIDPDGKEASLSFETLYEEGGRSLLQVQLETGRYHQIRLQLSARGWPILGDKRYGGRGWRGEGIALHHFSFKIPHPLSQERLQLRAPPPASFGLSPALWQELSLKS